MLLLFPLCTGTEMMCSSPLAVTSSFTQQKVDIHLHAHTHTYCNTSMQHLCRCNVFRIFWHLSITLYLYHMAFIFFITLVLPVWYQQLTLSLLLFLSLSFCAALLLPLIDADIKSIISLFFVLLSVCGSPLTWHWQGERELWKLIEFSLFLREREEEWEKQRDIKFWKAERSRKSGRQETQKGAEECCSCIV